MSEILSKLKEDLAILNSEIDDLIEELGPDYEVNPQTHRFDLVILEIEHTLEEHKNWLSSTNLQLFRTLSVSTLPPCVQDDPERWIHAKRNYHRSSKARRSCFAATLSATRQESEQRRQPPSNAQPQPTKIITAQRQQPFASTPQFAEKYTPPDMNGKVMTRTPIQFSRIVEPGKAEHEPLRTIEQRPAVNSHLTHTVIRQQQRAKIYQQTGVQHHLISATPTAQHQLIIPLAHQQLTAPPAPHQLTMSSMATPHPELRTSPPEAAMPGGGFFELPTRNYPRYTSTPLKQLTLGRGARKIPKFDGDVRKFRRWQRMFKIFVDDTPAPIVEECDARFLLIYLSFPAI